MMLEVYCTKQGVVDTIRAASELAGQPVKDSSGNYVLSGHTFRITGARFSGDKWLGSYYYPTFG